VSNAAGLKGSTDLLLTKSALFRFHGQPLKMSSSMKDFHEKRLLGRTGLKTGRLGISSSFGAPAPAYEEAFARGCNYFTWGTFIKGRSSPMAAAIKNICRQGKRDELVLAMLSYAHQNTLTGFFLERGLKKLGIDFADILILGYFSNQPPQRLVDGARKLKERGLVRYVGITSHNRNLFPLLAREGVFDLFHVRYSAAHPGAEQDVFPLLPGDNRPGIVTFTATAWGKLFKEEKMPAGEKPLSPAECYRFVLSSPDVDVCMMGAKDITEMRENLRVLDQPPLNGEEMQRVRKIGAYVHG
jgi:predicted aldo/keto reductase-like oxidoreductase